jgi:hypothetical protein
MEVVAGLPPGRKSGDFRYDEKLVHCVVTHCERNNNARYQGLDEPGA